MPKISQLKVSVVAAVNKMLAGSDDIIRQHKAACLRVTALLAVRERLWVKIFPPFSKPNLPSQVGTSAGVIVTLGLPHITATTTKLPSPPPLSGEQKCQLKSSILKFHRDTVICTDIENVEGNPHGHTGHVRFLTAVEMSNPSTASSNMIANSSSASNLMSSPSITSSLMSNSMPSSASLTSSSTTTSTDLGQPFGQAVASSGADTGRALRPGPRISPGGQGRILVSHYSLFWKSS